LYDKGISYKKLSGRKNNQPAKQHRTVQNQLAKYL